MVPHSEIGHRTASSRESWTRKNSANFHAIFFSYLDIKYINLQTNFHKEIAWTFPGQLLAAMINLRQMKDEAGTEVMTFSAVGDNQSVGGAKY